MYLPVVLLAEIDYLSSTRLGVDASVEFLESVASDAFTLVDFTSDNLKRCQELIVQYRDLPLGLADSAVAATAERLRIQRLFTVDVRHFRAIKPQGFSHFIILPADRESIE